MKKEIFDEFSFRDNIELMNLEHQMNRQITNNANSIGFNTDFLYNNVEQKEKKW